MAVKKKRITRRLSIAEAKLIKRREACVCRGCGKKPCECKHPRSSRRN